MNSSDAMLVYQLLKDYHETAMHLKALRGGLDSSFEVETHRRAATGWFNHVGTLYLRGLIDERTFRIVASERAAKMWVEFVAGLDREIRIKAGSGAEDMPILERFWREYSEGRLMTLQLVSAPVVRIQA